ncbi:septum formation inhibitor Maf [Pseudidiomarina atlantica]|jgi:septum formation protein|uniref:dTTP/UTP pyrophosphatase n=1 Tax=Pseudidiomarina atlantica TaxID=1517416 RepID=A0A094L2W9_9GAMM|nr:Maf family protein [Pseudidiomarina atlantica]KFZ28998.1 septum formation inhibitor Maf [Pseudidiomarina atlantica]
MELVLASGSPRRFELLQLLDRPFRVVHPDIIEQQHPHERPLDYVERLAREKAEAGAQLCASEGLTNAAVIGADTVVVCADQVLEKPRNEADYKQMMELLSGRAHQAITAVALHHNGATTSKVVSTTVYFKHLNAAEIAAYWQSGEPKDKAGGYGIQGRAGKFVTHIEGSYLAVVGLPLYETEQLIVQVEAAVAKDNYER